MVERGHHLWKAPNPHTISLEQHTSVKSFLNIFIEENALEYVVCEMAFILSQPQCVKHVNLKENH